MAQIRKIALSGFSRADEASFTQLFKAAAARSGGGFELCAEADAQALIIDADSIYGQMGLMQAQASGKLLIAITAGSRADADHKLDTPVSEDALVALMARLSGEASRGERIPPSRPEPAASRPPTTHPAARPAPPPQTAIAPAPTAASKPTAVEAPVAKAPTSAPAPMPASEPPRARSLFEHLQPGALQQPVQIQRGSAPLLVIDPASRTYLGGAALKPYVEYLGSALHDSELKAIPAARLDELEPQLGGRQPIQRLLWLSALHAGEGQLIGFDPSTRFRLGKWPQIEREFPKHFRIATVMMKAPATVDEIAAASGASREEVCDLLNAYLATGFAEPEQAQQTAAADTVRTGLLDRLRGLRS